MAFRCTASMPRLEGSSRCMFSPVGLFPGLSAVVYLGRDLTYARLELCFVVERGDDHMTPLVPLWVVLVVAHDEPGDAVVFRINLRHNANGTPAQAQSRRTSPPRET